VLLLAIERSTSVGSIAVYRDRDRLYLRHDPLRMLEGPDACAMVDAGLSALGLAPADIGRFAIGLGPGSFSGIRSALALVQGMALPSGTPVVGVSSAAAVALGVLRGTDVRRVSVVGDARRGHLWIASFEPGGATLRACGEIELVPVAEFAARVPDDALVVSPDWERLATVLRPAVPVARLVAESVLPSADAVGELALDAAAPHCEPPLPIYLHSAVVERPIAV
jgi:tRNA threonylcarbamoyladenosine biosynthesis protein TsaB